MRRYETRRDILTGAYSAHPDQSEKPFPALVRVLPVAAGVCALCRLATAVPNDRHEIQDGDTAWRQITATSQNVVTVPNKWPPFGPTSRADLVLARRHVTSLEDLEIEELDEFFAQMVVVLGVHQQTYTHSFASINVGRDAGSSQPHLHGQVVSAGADAPAPNAVRITDSALLADQEIARRHGLVLSDDSGACTYVAWAPSTTGEIRVTARDTHSLASAVQQTLRDATVAFGEQPYNVVVYGGDTLVAQVLPRFAVASVMPAYFGISIVIVAPDRVAAALRNARP